MIRLFINAYADYDDKWKPGIFGIDAQHVPRKDECIAWVERDDQTGETEVIRVTVTEITYIIFDSQVVSADITAKRIKPHQKKEE